MDKHGRKTGGRTKGALNKRTLEKLKEVQQEATAVNRGDKKYGSDVLHELMVTALGLAAKEQRRMMVEEGREVDANGVPVNRATRETFDRFTIALRCAGDFAKNLAPFQQPTFKAIAVVTPPTIPQGGDDARTVNGKEIDMSDPAAVARMYQTMVRVVR